MLDIFWVYFGAKRGRGLESPAAQSFNKPVRNYCRMFFYSEVVAKCIFHIAAILVLQSGSCYSVLQNGY